MNAHFIFFRMAQISTIDRISASNFVSGPMTDEDGFTSPGDRDGLSFSDFRDINLGAGKRQRIGGRIHLVDQRPSNSTGTYRTHGVGRDNNKVTTTRLVTIGL